MALITALGALLAKAASASGTLAARCRLLGQESIRDVILFPQLKPEA